MNEQKLQQKAIEELCRRKLIPYLCYTDQRYEPSAVHRYIAAKLEKIEKGEAKRLILTMPPRHGKSRLVGIDFPTWYLGKNPNKSVIMASYGEQLSLKHSALARDKCKEPRYQKIFNNCAINRRSQSKNTWALNNGGTFSATTVGGGLTGLGADLLIIDDPHKNRQEAESKLVRDRIWDWFASTAFTRLSPDGACIVIMTRWHVDDLVGTLTGDEYTKTLEDLGMPDEKWDLISLPAICEIEEDELGRKQGEALWPERWDVPTLEATRANVGSYEWTSLYRCSPRIRGGNYAKVDAVKYIEEKDMPKNLRFVRSWDLAITDKQKSDFSASCLAAYDLKEKKFYIKNIIRKKSTWLPLKQTICNLARAENVLVGLEAVSGFITAYEEVKNELMGKVLVKYYTPKENKMIRANPWLAALEAGNVYLCKGEWNHDFIDELSVFPDGRHDDQVDAVSLAWEMASKYRPLLVA